MSPSFPSDALLRFEARLRQSAEMFAARSLAPSASDETLALGFARRFGFLGGEAIALASLGADVRRALAARLEEENRRLLRAARRNAPAYDLGRHIAVRRALNALSPAEAQAPPRPQPSPDKPLSGRELNDRFRRRTARGGKPGLTLSPSGSRPPRGSRPLHEVQAV